MREKGGWKMDDLETDGQVKKLREYNVSSSVRKEATNHTQVILRGWMGSLCDYNLYNNITLRCGI